MAAELGLEAKLSAGRASESQKGHLWFRPTPAPPLPHGERDRPLLSIYDLLLDCLGLVGDS